MTAWYQERVEPAMMGRVIMLQLELTIELSGDTARVICNGRIVAGAESAELDRAIRGMPPTVKSIELDMEKVVLLDSSGIGVLVRQLMACESDGKQLRFAAMSPAVRKTIEVTNLLGRFHSVSQDQKQLPPGVRLLFAHPSQEIRTFISALLESRGANVRTCESVSRAIALTETETFTLIIVPAELDSAGLPAATTLALERQFLDREAEDAAEELIAGINAVLGAGSA